MSCLRAHRCNRQGLFSRAPKPSDEWYTPPEILCALGHFDLDPACGPDCPNQTAATMIGPVEDGLSVEWRGRVWLNPPFSNSTPWIDRMIRHGNGILLSFTRSDAGWYQRAIRAGGRIHALWKNRIRAARAQAVALSAGVLIDPDRQTKPNGNSQIWIARDLA